MPQELEVKLTLAPSDAEAAYAWLSSLPQATQGRTRTLINTYFDTPKAELNRRRAALRIRQAGDRFTQTLKTQGEFVAGAHRRQEWEWSVKQPALDFDLLADTPLASDINFDELKAAFETNFERRIVMLDDGEAVIECAIDRGEIAAGAKSVPLCEVEFELKSGNEARLLCWVSQLAKQVPFFINLISKAEQGYQLAGLHQPEPLAPDSDLVGRFFHGISVLWLTGDVTDELAVALHDVEEGALPGKASDVLRLFRQFRDDPSPARVQELASLQLALLLG